MRRVLSFLGLTFMAGGAVALGSVTINLPNGQTTCPCTLPNATVGVAYTPVTFSATDTTSGATFAWSPAGTLPPGLTLSTGGVLSGTPTQAQNTPYTFFVTVTDSTGSTASAQFSLSVQPAPLTITTVSPLFNGTIGVPYSQVFQATGGIQPYTWSITAGSAAPLTMNPNSGNLSGTPTAQGTLTFTVQVTDSSTPTPQTASQQFTISVDYPLLTIQTSTTLPSANVGLAYSQTISATGGDPPYTWSISNGSVPGISIGASTGVLSGTPTTAGTYSITIQVTDSATAPQHTASRTFSLVVSPVTLSIPAATLASGTAGVSYSQPLSAIGGTPPYTWSATGLPTGLGINSTSGNPTSGTISGTPLAAGPFQIVVQVTDSSPSPNVARQGFSLNFALPTVPSVSLTGIPSSSNAASQVPVQVSIGQAYSGDITGQLTLSFTPTQSGANDATIQFSTSGTTANFDIPAGQTSSSASLQFQTGTLPGTITVTLSQVIAFQVNVTPSTPPSQAVTIPTSAPVITSATLSVSGQNISVMVVGYTPTLAASQAVFNFGVSGNDQLQTSQFTVNTTSAFSTWFGTTCSASVTVCPNLTGSQFTYTQVFAVTGDATAVTLNSISLTNSQGTTSFTPTQ